MLACERVSLNYGFKHGHVESIGIMSWDKLKLWESQDCCKNDITSLLKIHKEYLPMGRTLYKNLSRFRHCYNFRVVDQVYNILASGSYSL